MVSGLVIGGIASAIGLGGFVTFLVLFIKSYVVEVSEWGTDVSSNADYMVLFFLFLMIALIGAYHIFTAIKKTKSTALLTFSISVTSLISFIYGLAKLIKNYQKNKPTTDYWVWTIVSIVLCLAFLLLYIALWNAKKPRRQAEGENK